MTNNIPISPAAKPTAAEPASPEMLPVSPVSTAEGHCLDGVPVPITHCGGETAGETPALPADEPAHQPLSATPGHSDLERGEQHPKNIKTMSDGQYTKDTIHIHPSLGGSVQPGAGFGYAGGMGGIAPVGLVGISDAFGHRHHDGRHGGGYRRDDCSARIDAHDTRDTIRDARESIEGRAKDGFDRVSERVKDTRDDLSARFKDGADRLSERVKDATDCLKDKIGCVGEDVKELKLNQRLFEREFCDFKHGTERNFGEVKKLVSDTAYETRLREEQARTQASRDEVEKLRFRELRNEIREENCREIRHFGDRIESRINGNQSGNSFGSGSGNGNQVIDTQTLINIGRTLGPIVQTKA